MSSNLDRNTIIDLYKDEIQWETDLIDVIVNIIFDYISFIPIYDPNATFYFKWIGKYTGGYSWDRGTRVHINPEKLYILSTEYNHYFYSLPQVILSQYVEDTSLFDQERGSLEGYSPEDVSNKFNVDCSDKYTKLKDCHLYKFIDFYNKDILSYLQQNRKQDSIYIHHNVNLYNETIYCTTENNVKLIQQELKQIQESGKQLGVVFNWI